MRKCIKCHEDTPSAFFKHHATICDDCFNALDLARFYELPPGDRCSKLPRGLKMWDAKREKWVPFKPQGGSNAE